MADDSGEAYHSHAADAYHENHGTNRRQHGFSFSLFKLPSVNFGAFGRRNKQAMNSADSVDEPFRLGDKNLPRRLTDAEVLTLGARAPFVIFVLIVGLFTYGYHLNPLVPWFVVVICFDFAVVATWPPPSSMQPRTHWDWFPMASCLFAVGMGVFCGLVNFTNIEAWVHVNFLQEFKDVLPTMNSATVSDAGVLNFAQGTKLDVESSAGYRVWPYDYCAAPIVGEDGSSNSPVTFWAVGVGCCKSRGDFTCDSAEDKEARKGIRLETHMLGQFVGHEVKENYEKAIKMAAAAYSMDAVDNPVLVAWHQNPGKVASRSWWMATIVFTIMIFVSLCCCMSCQSCLTQVRMMQK